MKYVIGAIVLCMILTGCTTARQEHIPLKLAHSVEIEFQSQQEQLHRIYTQGDKIDVILHYLHRLTPRGKPDSDPEQLMEEQCKITVELAAGENRVYRLRGKEYLSVDLKPWECISRERCSVLYHLIQRMEGDVTP